MATRPHSPYDLLDFTKLTSEFQIPGIDWQELIASQQKNLAALSRANQVMLEGAQAVMQREVEIMQKAMTEAMAASQEMMTPGDPSANAGKRFDVAKTSFETALANMRELAEMLGKSNREALDVINQRALEGFDEVRSAVEKSKGRGGTS
jgi:phasin family protein